MRRIITKIILWSGATLMMCGIFGLIAAMIIFNHYSKGLPSFESLAQYSPPVLTRLYAANGKMLAEYATERRIFVPLKAIPERVRQAFIAAEDKNFYAHKGIDIAGIGRAMLENVQNYGSGRSMVGGSTITQQVVKNFLLTNEKSLERKVKEAILAFRISQVYSKDKILELYLNEIYLGNGSYGVAAASMNYFNKPLSELSIEEAAMLAAMPKAPAYYDPRHNPQAAQERRNYVIGRMYDDGYMTQDEMKRASVAPIQLHARAPDEVVRAEFFSEEVRRTLAKMYGSQVLYEGGLVVKTTVDAEIQAASDSALQKALVDYDRRYGYRGALKNIGSIADWQASLQTVAKETPVPLYHGQRLAVVIENKPDSSVIGFDDGTQAAIALADMKWARKDLPGQQVGPEVKAPVDVLRVGDIVIASPLKDNPELYGLHQIPEVNGAMMVMDVHTGKVLAMSGGYSYIKTEFNRATQAKRQPGSAFKPIVYLAALENGFTPSTIVMDEPIAIDQGPGKPLWRPQNYEGQFMGATTLRVGLEKSRNTMTVRLAQMLGIGRIINIAKRLGVYSGNVPSNYSMVLGAYESTLTQMVTAYAMIANGGRRVSPSIIERIDDRNGAIIYRRDNRVCTGCRVDMQAINATATPPILEDEREMVIDPRIAYQLTSILEGVAIRGTAARARAIGKPVAGKTGTTNDSLDAWFIGYSPDLVAGVYIGYDQPRTLGSKETGGRVALPAFIDFMSVALKDQPARPFRMPPGIQVIQVELKTGLPPYPGIPSEGAVIAEPFVVGETIFKPALPEDAVEEASSPEVPDMYGETQEYDPYADWEDVDYYMTPEQAEWQDQRSRLNQPGANRMNPVGEMIGDSVRMDRVREPQYTPNPLSEPEPDGFNPDGARDRQMHDVYRRPAQNPGSGDSAVQQGTGGLY